MTAQIPDILHHRGAALDLCHDVLRGYLGRLRKDRRPALYKASTACHRGYVATWEIRDETLYLTAIDAVVRTERGVASITLAEAFPWAGETIAATWFSGEVRCPEGRLRRYVHHAFASEYERERILYFENGRLLSEHLILNPPLPIIYRIAPDGTRTCVEGFGYFAEDLPDPLAGQDLRDAHLVWGKVPDWEDDEEGYCIGGYLAELPPHPQPDGGAP